MARKPEAPVTETRKAYTAPRLTRYGSMTELTREAGCYVRKDSGSNAVCRRSP